MATHRLLVVDASAGIRDALATLFTGLGWDVRSAATVDEALTRLAEGPPPCCLILDAELPDCRCEAIVSHVRAEGLKTRVVVATDGASEGSDMVPGLDALLTKPVRVADVWGDACRVCGGV
jgi:CheY-like chemotaxis protein